MDSTEYFWSCNKINALAKISHYMGKGAKDVTIISISSSNFIGFIKLDLTLKKNYLKHLFELKVKKQEFYLHLILLIGLYLSCKILFLVQAGKNLFSLHSLPCPWLCFIIQILGSEWRQQTLSFKRKRKKQKRKKTRQQIPMNYVWPVCSGTTN